MSPYSAVQHPMALRFDPCLAPSEQFASEAGDGIGEARVEEAAGRRPEDTVEGVHQDLDGVALDGVARPARFLAPRQEFVEDLAQGFAGEAAEV